MKARFIRLFDRRLATLLVLLLGGSLFACGPARPDLTFAPATLPAAAAGQPYHATITVSGHVTPVGQIYVESGDLPPGLTINYQRNADSAEISGSPQQAGTFKFTIGAWCLGTNVSGQTGKQSYELTVK